jgi:SH3-like domain-containing protein
MNPTTSFRRKPESIARDSEHKNLMTRGRAFWIPAFAGMTIFVLLLVALSTAAFAANESEEGKAAPSGLPMPRFASLRSDDVNMRTGPGTRYPIEWVYRRKGLPVEILSEFEVWRRVRDFEGAEGWVHKSALSGKRTALVAGASRNLLQDGANDAPVAAHLENGAMGQVLSCAKDWCRLKFDGVKGYLRKNEFWGVYPDETFN